MRSPAPALLGLCLACGGADSGAPDADPSETTRPTPPRPSTLLGAQDGGRFGVAVATLPDADADGAPEWVAAASAAGSLRQGAVWTGSGLPSADGAVAAGAAWVSGERDIERLGQALAEVGDLDGDGRAELVLGAIHLGDPARMHGGVRVLWGTGEQTALLGDGMMEHAGWAVSGGGPAGGTVLVGTPYRRSTDGALDARGFPEALGRVYVLDDLRAGTLEDGARATLEGAGSWAGFGAAVAGTDLDGDGLDDALVGVPSGTRADGTIGRLVWFAGPLDGSRTLDDRDGIWEGEPGDHLGFAIAAGGDLDGDGHGDVAVGAYKAGDDTDDAGAVVLIDGATRQVSGRLVGAGVGAMLGASVGFRPLEGGRAELVAGAPGWRVEGARSGAVARHRGVLRGVVEVAPETLLPSPARQAEFGAALASTRDLDGDGAADLVVGAPGWWSGQTRPGAVLFFSGEAL